MPHKSQELVDYAIQSGNPYFETCYFYMDYKCEEFIYNLLTSYQRSEYQLCGKLPIHSIKSEEDFSNILEEQFNKVPGNYFDDYVIQAADEECSIILYEQKVIPHLLKLKRHGKIKRLGLSIQCTPEEFKNYLKLECWDFIQMPLNYFDWFLCRGKELYELACNYDLPIIAQAPLKGGLLAKFKIANAIPAAYSFIANLPNVEKVLLGTTSVNHYKEAENWINSELNNYEYDKIISEYLKSSYIKCIGCNRCVDTCKLNIPIRSLFKMYNMLVTEPAEYYNTIFNCYNLLNYNNFSAMCNNCNQCIDTCPMNLNIPKLLQTTIWEIRT